MKPLKVHFFGSFQVITEDPHRSITLKTEKSRALFVFLLTENDRPHRRAKLVDLFWSEFPDKAAHNSLRQSLYHIRTLSADIHPSVFHLSTSSSDIQLIPQPALWADTFELTAGLDQCESHHKLGTVLCGPCLDLLTAAVNLYSAEFMDGFSLPDAPQFDWWLLNKREIYNRRVLQALAWISESLMAKKEYGQAVRIAQREIELDPWCEPAHQRYMKVLALAGERGKALHHFEVCQRILSNDLGIEPCRETRCLCEQIRKGDLSMIARSIG
jgi:DNA-binding SARP family transcriptional activator